MRRFFPDTIGHALEAVERKRGLPRPALTLVLAVALLLGLTLAVPMLSLACQCDDTTHAIDANADVDPADDSDDADPLSVNFSAALPLAWLPPTAFPLTEFAGWIPNPGQPPAIPPPILG